VGGDCIDFVDNGDPGQSWDNERTNIVDLDFFSREPNLKNASAAGEAIKFDKEEGQSRPKS
jgi:hypothetical protein